MEKYREYLSELNDMLLRSGVDLELEKQIEEGTLEIPVLVLEQYLEFNKSLAISDSGQAIKVASGTGNMLYNNILYEQLKGEYEETVKNALALLYSEAVDDNPMSEEEKFQARIDAFNEYLQENKELEEEELRVDEEETPSNLVPFDKTQRYTGLTYTVDSIIEGTSQGTDLSYDEINAQNGVGGYDDTVYTEIVEDTDDDLVSDLDTLLEDEEEQGTEAEDEDGFSEDSEDEDYDDSIYTGEEDEDDSSEDEDDSLEDEDFSLEEDDDSSEDDDEDYGDYDNLLEDDDTSSEDEDEDYSDYDNLLEDEDSSSEDDDDEDESAFDIPEVESEEEGYSDDDDDESAFDLPDVDEDDEDDEDEESFDLPEVDEGDESEEGYSEDDDDDDSLDDYTYQEEDTDSEEDEDDEDESAFNLPEVDDDSDDADEDDDESSFDLPEVDDDDSEEDYDEDFNDLGVASPPDPPVPASQSITNGTKPQIKKDSNDYFADAILGVNDKVIKIPGWFRNKNTQKK